MLKKRGYIFTLDAMLAVMVVVAGFFLISGSIISVPDTSAGYESSYGIATTFTDIKIKDINYQDIDDMVSDGTISTTDILLIQQVGKFYEEGEYGNAYNITHFVVASTLPQNFDFALQFDGMIIYNTSDNYDKSSNLVSTKSLTYGKTDDMEIWGPYEAEVWVWR